jgi:glucokinase
VTARGGIDLGGTKIQAVVVEESNKVLGQARRPTPTDGGPEDVVAALADALTEAAQQAGVETASLIGVGVGSPGEIDQSRGTVSQARNLPGWDGSYPLGPKLLELVGAPVFIGNDVQVATDAEFQLGAGKPYSSILGVFWGTGVGGGIVLDGKPWTGRGAAGEIGHVVIKVGGARCGCGRRGCMEAYAGRASMEAKARRELSTGRGTKLFEIMEQRGRTRLTSGVWARAVAKGDKLALELIERAVRALGAGVASACNVLDVEAIVIGGGMGVRFGEEYVKRIERAMMPHLFASEHPPAVRLATLGDLGGGIGAALLAVDRAPAARPRTRAARAPARR